MNMNNDKGNGCLVSRITLWLGIGCIFLGILFNKVTIGYLFSPDHEVANKVHQLVILVFEAIMVIIGLYLVIRRPVVSYNNALIAFISSILTIFLGGLAIQIFYSPPPVISGWRVQALRLLELNQLNYRGKKIEYMENDFVILLIGDSNIEAKMCSFDWLPESRLEHYLNLKGKKVKVFALGASGYGQDQQLLALKDYYSKYRADMVLLWQEPLNDVWNNIFPTHWPTNSNPKPTFWLEDGELKGPSEQIGEELKYPSFKLLALFKGLNPSIWQRDTWWERRLPPPYRPLTDYNGPVSNQWQEWFDKRGRYFMRYENLEIGKNHFAIRLTPRSKRMEYGIELTRRLLNEIEKEVVEKNGKFIVFNVFTPTDETVTEEQVYVLNGKLYRTSEQQFRKNLDDINADFEYLRVNVTLDLWRVGPADYSHLNEHANDQAMMNLANMIAPSIPDL